MATWNLQKRSRQRARRALTKVVFPVVLRRVARRATTQDTIPPSVTVVSPAAGSSIRRTDAVVLDVVDAEALRRVVISVEYPDLRVEEVVWAGSSFVVAYEASTRATIPGGHRYSLRRVGGWRAAPRFRIHALDTSGNEAT